MIRTNNSNRFPAGSTVLPAFSVCRHCSAQISQLPFIHSMTIQNRTGEPSLRSILEKLDERNRPSVQVHMLCNFSGYTGMTHYISIFNQIPCNRLTGHSTPGATCPIQAAGTLGKPQNTRPEAGTPQRKVRTICIESTEKSVIIFWNFP